MSRELMLKRLERDGLNIQTLVRMSSSFLGLISIKIIDRSIRLLFLKQLYCPLLAARTVGIAACFNCRQICDYQSGQLKFRSLIVLFMRRYHTPSDRQKKQRDNNPSLDRLNYKRKVDLFMSDLVPYKKNTVNSYQPKPTQNTASNFQQRKMNSFHRDNYKNVFNPEKLISKPKESPSVPRRTEINFSQFHKGKMLAEGKFGKVFVVKHKLTGTVYALKVMSKQLIQKQNYQNQLIQEIKIQMFVKDRQIIRLYGFFHDKDNIYLLQELGVQQNLYFKLKTCWKRRLQLEQVKSTVKMIVQGIATLHRLKIIHRDLKPQNIIITLGVPKICDFGWSTVIKPRIKCFCGTLDYIAPQIIKNEQHNEKVDVWCLGILTYELLCGCTPFTDQTENKIFKNIVDSDEKLQFPAFVGTQERDFIRKCLANKAQLRPSADELLQHQFLSD